MGALTVAATGLRLSVNAEFKQAPSVSVERLLKNTAAFIKEHPDDPQGYYVLGRLHHLAFAMKVQDLPTYGVGATVKSQLPEIDNRSLNYRDDLKKGLTDEEAAVHLKEGLAHYRKAIQLKPDRALYHLSLASLMETAASPVIMKEGDVPQASDKEKNGIEESIKDLAAEAAETRTKAHDKLLSVGLKALPVLVTHAADEDLERRARVNLLIALPCKEKAKEEYLKSYELGKEQDLAQKHVPIDGVESLVTYEAGEGFLRLLKGRHQSDTETKKAEEIAEHLKNLKGLPPGKITPIVFSLHAGVDACMADLLDDAKTVRFDLDGDERPELRRWVKPETCILVWDPEGRGKITSGRQLFGSVTWWIFWNDGYHALDALDDNRDGRLSGEELRGLAVWRDANSNGVSDPGEVAPLSTLEIESLSVRATGLDGASPICRDGLRMKDGSTLPTFDWIAPAVNEKATTDEHR
ncbi:MAG: hypothetical protein HY291_19110 [Planctomycetes bacterium]|nr:hypothetical protein [Planctomycetota bacterium]